jgi:hypothetical protein
MTYTRFVTDLISSSPQKPENLSNLAVEIEKPTTHEPLSLAVQCAKIIKQNYDLKNLSSYPDTVQQKVLQQADNFKEWVALKAYMDYDVLQHSAKDWLQKEGISYTPLDRKRYTAEEKLLGHLFDQKITSKLSSIEQPVLEQLIQKKRGIASSLQASALKVQTLAEKIQDLFIQKILLNKYFYYPAGAALGLYVGLKSIQVIWNAHQLFLVKILPQALEIAKKHIPTPVKEAALATYHTYFKYQIRIVLGALFVNYMVPRTSRFHNPAQWLFRAACLPFTLTSELYFKAVDAGYWVARKVFVLTPQVGRNLKEVSVKQRNRRFQAEIAQSRQMWINLTKAKPPVNQTKFSSFFKKIQSYFPKIRADQSFLSAKVNTLPVLPLID